MRRVFDSTDRTQSHSHDFLSLIYILSGEAKYEIGGKVYDISPGMLFVCNPGVTHHRMISKNQRIEEFQIGISDLNLKGLPENYLLPENESPLFNFNRYGQAFYNTIGEIIVEQQKNDEFSVLMLKCIVMKLLVYIIKERYIPHSEPANNVVSLGRSLERYDKMAIVNNIRTFITENYMKPISLAKISANAYLSPIYVSKVFKEATGESPINYLIRVRLSRACELLDNTDISVKEVARHVGYKDVYYFSKLFKKYYGVSPLFYRKAKAKPAFKIPSSDR